MSDRDNITLLREVVEKIHEAWSSEVYPPAASTEWYDIMDALRTALAAETPKPEPVVWWDVNKPLDYLTRCENGTTFHNRVIMPRHAVAWAYTNSPEDIEALRRDAERLTDEQIDSATSKERDDLLDHIYEYGTAAEGIFERIRKLARAAIDAAMGDKR